MLSGLVISLRSVLRYPFYYFWYVFFHLDQWAIHLTTFGKTCLAHPRHLARPRHLACPRHLAALLPHLLTCLPRSHHRIPMVRSSFALVGHVFDSN